jgi:hypothetical protein
MGQEYPHQKNAEYNSAAKAAKDIRDEKAANDDENRK